MAADDQTFDIVVWNNSEACNNESPCWKHFRTSSVSVPSFENGSIPDNILVLPVLGEIPGFKAGLWASNLDLHDSRRVYDVRQFGAHGDGETEDTMAFQAAMNAARGGGMVYVPVGNYPIRRVEVFSDTVVLGQGAQSVLMHAEENLDKNPRTSIMLTNRASNIIFKDLHFHGNLAAHEYSGRPGNANSKLLDLLGGSNIAVVNNYFSEALAGEAIDLDSPRDSRNYFIVGNYINMTAHDRTGEGILSRGHGHLIANNFIIGADSGHRAAIGVDNNGSQTQYLII